MDSGLHSGQGHHFINFIIINIIERQRLWHLAQGRLFPFLISSYVSSHLQHSGGSRFQVLGSFILSISYTHQAVMICISSVLVGRLSFLISFCSMFIIITSFKVRSFVHFERARRDRDTSLFAKKIPIRFFLIPPWKRFKIDSALESSAIQIYSSYHYTNNQENSDSSIYTSSTHLPTSLPIYNVLSSYSFLQTGRPMSMWR